MKLSFNLFKCVCPQLLEQNTKQLALYKHRYKSRKLLLKLDDDMLKDIGISRMDAEVEARKPFWKGDSFKPKQANESAVEREDKRKSLLIKAAG